MNDINLNNLSRGELETLKKKIDQEILSRANARFDELTNTFMNAYENLVTEFPYCCILIGLKDEDGDEIDLNGFINSDNFRFVMEEYK